MEDSREKGKCQELFGLLKVFGVFLITYYNL